MPLCGRNWAASICMIVVSTSCPNSRRCSSVIVVCRYWVSTRRLRTKTTWATADAILLAEAVEQLNALLEHAIPAIAMRVLKLVLLMDGPILKQGNRRVLAEKVGAQSPFKGAAEEHGCPGIFLFPAIDITMTVASRAGEVLADLGVAINHQATSDPGGSSAAVGESSCQRLRGANQSRLRTEMPCTMVWLTFSTPCNPTSA